MSRTPIHFSNPPAQAPPRKMVWWKGVLTIVFFACFGTLIAVAVQAGTTWKYEDSPELLNTVFICLALPGIAVQWLIAGGTHVPTASERQAAETLSLAVNSVFYTALLLAWFLRPNDNKLKK